MFFNLIAGGTVKGVVLDGESSEPLRGVRVIIPEKKLEVFTDEEGKFIFENIEYGIYNLQFSLPLYKPLTLKVNLNDTVINLLINMFFTGYRTPVIVVTDDHPKTEFENMLELSYTLKDKELQKSLGQTLAMTLKSEAGISIRSMGPAPSRPVFRGLSGDRIILSEDGIKTADLSSTSPDHSVTVEPFTIERVEILRGPESVIKSPVTIGGVINVVRNEIPQNLPSGLTVKSGFFGESSNKGFLFSTVAEIPYSKFALRGEGTYRKTSDQSTPEGKLKNSFSETYNFSTGLSFINNWGFTGLSLREFNTAYGIPGGFVGAHPEGVKIEMLRRQYNFKLHYNFHFTLLDHIDAEFSRVYYRHTEFEKNDIIGAEFKVINWLGYVNLFHNKLSPLSKGIIGMSGELRNFNIGGFVFSPPSISKNLAFYINEEINLMKWQFGFAIRYDYNKIKPEKVIEFVNLDTIYTRIFNTFSLSISGVRKISKGFNAGFILSHFSRVPTIEELYSDGPHLAAYSYEIGKPDLEYERGYGSEAFVNYKSGKFYSMLSVFYNYLPYYIIHRNTGMINYATLLPVYQTQGVKARIYGLEAHSEIKITDNFFLNGMFNLSFGDIINYGPLPQMPPGRINITTGYSLNNYLIGISFEAVSSQKRVDDSESSTAGYLTTNLFSQYSFYTGKIIHNISLNIDNLTNRIYRNHLSRIKSIYPEQGINVRLIYKLYY
ncbi:MAG: TonB-dependent receptor [Ignavibacteria bacterium]|nr:TonB-dependent receptor [Ignavibacteria bacterium]